MQDTLWIVFSNGSASCSACFEYALVEVVVFSGGLSRFLFYFFNDDSTQLVEEELSLESVIVKHVDVLFRLLLTRFYGSSCISQGSFHVSNNFEILPPLGQKHHLILTYICYLSK